MMNFDTPSRLIRSIFSLALGIALLLSATSVSAQDRDKKDPYLSEDEISLIQVYEVDLKSDPPPRIVIPRDELRKFLKDFQEDDRIPRGKQAQEKWLRADGYKQLQLLFSLKARDYYKHVRVRTPNESLRAFSNIHRRYILGYFQPTFGAGSVPELFLFPRGRQADRIEMTNFYILTQTTVNGIPLIDRNVPEESLLVQWGLPRESAKFPAPEVDGWEPKFKSTDDERFQEFVKWIESLVAVNQGSNYGIQYTPPKHQQQRN